MALFACSLLRDPKFLHELVKHIVGLTAGKVPVSVKMRAGYRDTSLFLENVLGLQAAGASFVTVHPRTRSQAYSGRADWDLIAKAKQALSIPVVCIPFVSEGKGVSKYQLEVLCWL